MQIQNNTYRLQLNMAPTIILAVSQELRRQNPRVSLGVGLF